MNTIKAIVAALFIVTTALTAHAQERYEQMTITYAPATKNMTTSTDNGEYTEETVAKSENKGLANFSPALERVKQLSEQGWELYQNSVMGSAMVFHLRRPMR